MRSTALDSTLHHCACHDAANCDSATWDAPATFRAAYDLTSVEFSLRIDGMHCGACVRRVSQVLAAVPGVTVREVRIGAARLSTAQDQPPAAAVLQALANAGYTARLEEG